MMPSSTTSSTTSTVVDANVARLSIELLDQVRADPAFLCLDESGAVTRTVTYGELDAMVAAVAGGLRRRGVTRGSRVVVFVPMSLELYITLLSVLRLGAVATFIEPWGGRRMIDHAARLVEADAFIGVPKAFLLRLLSPALRRVKLAVTTGERWIPGAVRFARLLDTPATDHVREATATRPEEPALVTFTTGSTGTPKGANRTHDVLLAQHHALAREVPGADGARIWTNLPVVVLHNLGRGMATVLPPAALAQQATPDPVQFHRLVEASRASILATSPATLHQLGAVPGATPLAHVRRVYTGGGPVTPRLLADVAHVLPDAEIVVLYGSTEAEPIAHATGAEVLARRDAMRQHGGIFVGHDVDDVELLLVQPDDGAIELASGEAIADRAIAHGAPGEVLVRGDHVNRDYWRNPEAVRMNKVRDEQGRIWHRTGDIARRDDAGGLWLLGRNGQHIDLPSGRRWALELETPITDLPDVARAALLPPLPGEPSTGRALLAVELIAQCGEVEGRAAVTASLAQRGLSDEVELLLLDEIPVDRRHATKIDVEALRLRVAR